MLRPAVVVLIFVTFIFSINTGVAEGHNKNINKTDISGESPEAILDVTTDKILGEDVEYEDEDEEEDDDDEDETNEKNTGENKDEKKIDEYEVELREVAESHEAMSRDDRHNSTVKINNSDSSIFTDENKATRNFDSHEKSIEEHSDESITSNEAISTENDKEVKELLEFKHLFDEKKKKIKRVPTVKKELSTQKEIQGNVTVLAEPTKITSQLEDKRIGYSPVRTNDLMDQDGIRHLNSEKSIQGEVIPGDEYVDSDTSLQILGKLDKRQESDLDSSEAYPPSPHIPEFEKHSEIQEVTEELETVLAEELMDRILTKLASRPSQYDYASRLLKNLLDHLEASRSNSKRSSSPTLFDDLKVSTKSPIVKPKSPQKKPKKKKKKKKKPRRFGPIETLSTSSIKTTTTTMTNKLTPVTTSSPEITTKSRWRLVAEKLFNPIWSNNNDKIKNINKIQRVINNSKQQEYINDEPSVILESTREYSPNSRKFHFGKINTHEKGSPQNQHDTVSSRYKVDTSDSSNSRLLDYDLSERAYHHQQQQQQQQRPKFTNDMYNQYQYQQQHPYQNMNLQRDFDTDPIIDYDDTYTDVDYSRLRSGFRNKPRKYHRFDMSKFHDPLYDDDNDNDDDNNSYRNNERKNIQNKYNNNNRKNWSTRWRQWKDYWRPIIQVDEEIDKTGNNRRIYGKFDSTWPVDDRSITKNEKIPWTIIDDTRKNIYNNKINRIKDINNNKNDTLKDDNIKNENLPLPKITMTTWNSLTSDPATWPFKLSGAKPWPKDKNGKSYNPNAELVHKLGLDKQNRLLNVKNNNDDDDNKISEIKESQLNSNNNNWKTHEKWPDNDDNWPSKLNNWDVELSKQSNNQVTWSPKWKQFTYHKVNNLPLTKTGNIDNSIKSKNSYIAVSALSSDWHKNDIEEIPIDINNNNINSNNDDPTRQMLFQQTPWKKSVNASRDKIIINKDTLENQLDDLRQNHFNKHVSSTQATYLQSTILPVTTTIKKINTVNKSLLKIVDNEKISKSQ